MLKVFLRQTPSFHFLVDLFLLTNAYLISKFVFSFYEKKLFFFNFAEWAILLAIASIGLILIRSSWDFPYTIDSLKKKVFKLLFIIFLGECLRFSLGFISTWLESMLFSFFFSRNS